MEELRKRLWNRAFHAFGTAYIFERRASELDRRLRRIQFAGLALPLAVGSLVIAWGLEALCLSAYMMTASALAVAHTIVTLWSVVGGWDNHRAYSIESCCDNGRLSNAFASLAAEPPSDDVAELALRSERLEGEYAARTAEDIKRGVTEKEKRMGMRAALRYFKRRCDGCGETPTSMHASKCEICGRF